MPTPAVPPPTITMRCLPSSSVGASNQQTLVIPKATTGTLTREALQSVLLVANFPKDMLRTEKQEKHARGQGTSRKSATRKGANPLKSLLEFSEKVSDGYAIRPFYRGSNGLIRDADKVVSKGQYEIVIMRNVWEATANENASEMPSSSDCNFTARMASYKVPSRMNLSILTTATMLLCYIHPLNVYFLGNAD